MGLRVLVHSNLAEWGFKNTAGKIENTRLKVVINSLPNNKILYWSTLKTFADDILDIPMMIIFVFDRVENVVERGENAVYQQFLLFLQYFPSPPLGSLKVAIKWELHVYKSLLFGQAENFSSGLLIF